MPTEKNPSEPVPALATGDDLKRYPDRLCHIDYTAHPYRCGCLNGDDEAQRRFDEHQRDAKLAKAESAVERLTAERDALQARLTVQDQGVDDLKTLLPGAQLALRALNVAVSVYDVELADNARRELRKLIAALNPTPKAASSSQVPECTTGPQG